MQIRQFGGSYLFKASPNNINEFKILAIVIIIILDDFDDDDNKYGIREESCRYKGINIIHPEGDDVAGLRLKP